MQSHVSQVALTFGIQSYFMCDSSIQWWCISIGGLNSKLYASPCSHTTCWVVDSFAVNCLGKSVSQQMLLPFPSSKEELFLTGWLSCFLRLWQVLSTSEIRIQAAESDRNDVTLTVHI